MGLDVNGSKIETPELDKMAEVRECSQAVGEFLEWLGQEGWHIARPDPGSEFRPWHTYSGGWESLLAKHFEIDLDKVETERRAILAALRGEKPE